MDGEEAYRLGLVSELYPSQDLVSRCVDRASELARFSAPMSMALSKHLLWENTGIRAMQARENVLFDWLAVQPDAEEGVASFLEKREPRWHMSVSKDFPHHLLKDTL